MVGYMTPGPNRSVVSIGAVDTANRLASGTFADGSECGNIINCRNHVGAVQVTPAVGEQWVVELQRNQWALINKLPVHTPDLDGTTKPTPGQVQIGSSGPLELFGSSINLHGPLDIGSTKFSVNDSGKLTYSLDGGITWVPVGGSGSGGGGGGVDSTDDVPEGSTNKYFTVARAAAAAPVRTVAGRTADVVLTKTDVGLNLVNNTSDLAKPLSTATSNALNTKADLVSGTVPLSQLPPRPVRAYANLSSFPLVGVAESLYIAADTTLLYFWDPVATAYSLTSGVSVGLANTDSLPEGPTNKYYTDARVLTQVNARITALYGFTAATITEGNDPRLTDQRVPVDNSVTATKIPDGTITLAKLSSAVQDSIAASPYDVSFPQTLGQRAVGPGQNYIGVKLTRPVTFTRVVYRCGTADASGNLVVELRKNGSTVAGSSVTIAAANQTLAAGTVATGTWPFVAGDILTVYITAVGTTVGVGLVADVKGDA